MLFKKQKIFWCILFLLFVGTKNTVAQNLSKLALLPLNNVQAGNITIIDYQENSKGEIFELIRVWGILDVDPGFNIYSIDESTNGPYCVIKFDSNFNLQWAKGFGNSVNRFNCNPKQIESDNVGNIIIAGNFKNTVDFGPDNFTYSLSTNDSADIFILKLDNNGNFKFVKTFGNSGYDDVSNIAINSDDDITIAGPLLANIDFDPGLGIFTLPMIGSSGLFINSLDSNGHFLWAKGFNTTGYFGNGLIKVDSQNNYYVYGSFSDTVDFDPSINTIIKHTLSSNQVNGFVCKLDNLGNFVWVKLMESKGVYDYNEIWGLTIDKKENIYLTCTFMGVINVDPTIILANDTSLIVPNRLVMKLDKNGNYKWHQRYFSNNYFDPLQINYHENKLLVYSSIINDNYDLDLSANTFSISNNSYLPDIFFAQYDTNFNFICASQIKGSGPEIINKCNYSNNGILLAGQSGTNYNLDLDPSNDSLLFNTYCSFLLKLTPNHPAYTLPDSGILHCLQDSILINCSLNDADTDYCHQLLYFLDSTQSTFGSCTIDSFSGVLTYKPFANNPCNVHLMDTIHYTVADQRYVPLFTQGYALVYIDSCPCQYAPIANPDSTYFICKATHTFLPLANDADSNAGQIISITNIITNGLIGTASHTDTSIVYTPPLGYHGTTTLQYVVCDNGNPSKCDTATVTVIVGFCNAAPIAMEDTVTVNCLDSISINVLLNDVDTNAGQTLSITQLLTQGLQGSANISANQIIFHPIAYTSGVTTLQYIVCDNDSNSRCDTATVTLIVKACNRPPIAVADAYNTACQGTITIHPLTNDVELDTGQILQVSSLLTLPAKGTVTLTGDSIVYTAFVCKKGIDSFAYTVCDNHAQNPLCDTGWIYVTIANCFCDVPEAKFSVNLDSICSGSCVQLQDSSTNFTNTWLWICDGANPNSSQLANPIFCFANAGRYNITLIAKNIYGNDTVTVPNAVTVFATPQLIISKDTNVIVGATVPLVCTGALMYTWQPIAGLINPIGGSTLATIQQPIQYICTASSAEGCTSTAFVNIGILNSIIIPNAFSPNGDGLNDFFEITMPAHASYYLQIRNRLGNLVFESTNPQISWNGNIQNTPAAMDTYYYFLRWKNMQGIQEVVKGDLLLIR
jgi:gliding motility-associated-like protein